MTRKTQNIALLIISLLITIADAWVFVYTLFEPVCDERMATLFGTGIGTLAGVYLVCVVLKRLKELNG